MGPLKLIGNHVKERGHSEDLCASSSHGHQRPREGGELTLGHTVSW